MLQGLFSLLWIGFNCANRNRLGMDGGFRRVNVIQTVLAAFHLLGQDSVLMWDYL